MFPDIEDDVLQSVLASCGGDPGSAVEVLLNMTDSALLASAGGASSEIVAAAGPGGQSYPDASPALSSADTAAQLAEDEELAHQLQQQMLWEDEMAARAAATAAMPGYPGQMQMAGIGGWPYVGMPQHGMPYNGAPAGGGANHEQRAGGGDASEGSVGDSLSSAGAAVASAANSWWSWATGADGSARRGHDEPPGGVPAGIESHEMQPMRRVQRLDEADVGEGAGSERDVVLRGEAETPISIGGGGEVRRRARHARPESDLI